MRSLPEGMENLVNLEYLYLNGCTNLKKLPDGMFENLTNNLSTLDLSGCENLEMLPEGISMLTSLTELDLSRCKSMTSLPKGMENLVNLEDLRLNGCTNLKKLPDGMFETLANSLSTLDLGGCENLEILLEGISTLTSLTELNLSRCTSIISLPKGMENLVNLKDLRLNDCTNLKKLPDGMFETLANSLLILDLGGCENLEMLLEGISTLTSLTKLNLSRCNSITSLPKGMENLVNLEYLNLSYCRNVERLPNTILMHRVGNRLVVLSLIECEKLGFVESMTEDMVRNASCNLGLAPNRCHFVNVKRLVAGQRESLREEVFRLRSSFPSVPIENLENGLEWFDVENDVAEALELVAWLMRGVRPSREGRSKDGVKEVVLLY
jgi:Leucine-rich repeat (LRR) protein